MNFKHKRSIDVILHCFDFEKVHKTMTLLNWKWSNLNGNVGVPSIQEIKQEAERLLISAADSSNEEYYMACGGLEAHKFDGNFFELKFVVTEWDNSEEFENGTLKWTTEEREKVKGTEKEITFDNPLIALEV